MMRGRRVLLINPPSPTPVSRRYCGTIGAQGFLYPPLELAQLAAVAREWHGCEAEVLDAVALGLDEDAALRRAARFGPDIVVSMSGFSTFLADARFTGRLKREMGSARVGAMGYLPSRYAAEYLQRTQVDFVLLDEPELPLSRLIAAGSEEPAGLPGLAWRTGSESVVCPDAGSTVAMDELPFAEPRGIELSHYREVLQPVPMWSVLTARGCPFTCSFCVTTYGKTARFRTAANVVREVELLTERYGVRAIRFVDDTFTLQRERVLEICEGLRGLRRPPSWTALSRLDCLDDEVLAAMKRAGCRRIDAGVESGSQRILDRLGKGLRVEQVPGMVRRIRAHGIEALGFFVVGAPEESAEEVESSLRLAIDSGLDYIVVTRLQTWPGTPMAARDSLVPRPPASPFDGPHAVAEAAGAERRLYRSFYFRPGYVLPRLPRFLARPMQAAGAAARLLAFVVSSGQADLI